jgi:predicted outer membrane repeat protein
MRSAKLYLLLLAAAPAVLLSGCSSSTGPGEALPATYTVDAGGGADFASIGQAIAAAVDGDTLLVLPGTYTGPDNRDMSFGGRGITLVSRGGADSTTIDLENQGRAFILHGRGRSESLISGFTITRGSAGRGGGMSIIGTSPTLSDLTFTLCEADDEGGALFVSGGSPALTDVTFDSNTAFYSGGGMFCQSGASPALRDVVFERNEAGSGGGLSSVFSTLALTAVRFENNEANSDGGGLYLGLSEATLDSVVFFANEAARYGGGLDCQASSPDIERSSFVWNGGAEGGGAHCDGGSNPTFRNSIIAFSFLGVAVATEVGSTPEFYRSCVHGNFGGDDIGTVGVDVIDVDPLFCGLYDGDLTLCSNSPCLPENNAWTEQLGAEAAGCDSCSSSTPAKLAP